MQSTVFSSNKYTDTERREIDEDIRRLLTRRNRLAPILMLPPNVIISIVDLVRDPVHSHDHRLVIAMTHTCTYMRNIIINSPSLWTIIDPCASAEWNAEYLRRSKDAPLEIQRWWGIPYVEENMKKSMKLLKGQEWRFKTIVVSLHGKDLIFFEAPAPQLKVLSINSKESGTDLSVGTFSKPMKALRLIDLTNCRFSWTSTMLTNLTTINLYSALTTATPQIILTMLNQNPALQDLVLQHIPMSGDTIDSPAPDVHLSKLKAISLLYFEPHILRFLFPRIHIPSTASFMFRYECPTPMNSLGQHFRDMTRSLRDVAIDSLALHDGGCAWDIELVHERGVNNPSFAVNLGGSRGFQTLKEAAEVATTLPIGSVKKLRVGLHDGKLPALVLLRLFEFCPRLQMLNLYGSGAVELFSQLVGNNLPGCSESVFDGGQGLREKAMMNRDGNGDDDVKGHERPRHVCDQCSVFKTSVFAQLQNISLSDGTLDFCPALEKYLVLKDSLGMKLACLTLYRCSQLTQDDVDRFQKNVEVVEWDGIVESVDDGGQANL